MARRDRQRRPAQAEGCSSAEDSDSLHRMGATGRVRGCRRGRRCGHDARHAGGAAPGSLLPTQLQRSPQRVKAAQPRQRVGELAPAHARPQAEAELLQAGQARKGGSQRAVGGQVGPALCQAELQAAQRGQLRQQQQLSASAWCA